MTSASELFYTRRSRSGRISLDLGFDSSLDRSFHPHGQRRHHHQHHNGTRRDRHDLDVCDPPPRRTPAIRHHSHRPSNSDHDAVRPDGGRLDPGSNIMNVDNFGGIRSSMTSSGNDRLPGAVLLARERLLQRLRGVSLSGTRERNRVPSRYRRNNITVGDDFRLVDAGDWETEFSTEGYSDNTLFMDPTHATDELPMPQATSMRSPGLAQEALKRLQVETFRETESSKDGVTARTSTECSICLENFVAGDGLTCLPCGHRFHRDCLDPWVRTCGDCPYCRTDIVVNR